MKLEYERIADYGLQFKHIISGPAPVGRILNYVKLTGRGVLRHKHGSRDLHLNDNIGSAWATEFMVGLGLVYYKEIQGETVYPLKLTPKGKELYELIKNGPNFDEAPNIRRCKQQLLDYSEVAYHKFESIFKASVVRKNLYKYLVNKGCVTFRIGDFLNDYFGCFVLYYTGETYIYSTTGGATTGENRVPSLVQLCKFFDYVFEDHGYYTFNLDKLAQGDDEHQFINIDSTVRSRLDDEEQRNEIIIKNLIERYGVDGTVAREIVTRNSSVQDIFRNNLIARYGCKCFLCDKDIETVLVASHIKPACECNVVEKADCENGLLLCALHDKLFDRYLISFDFNTGKLLYCKELEGKLDEYQLSSDMCLKDEYMTPERKMYLMDHNMKYYERNK